MEPTASPFAASASTALPAAAVAQSRDDDTLQITTHTDESSGLPIVAASGDVDLCTAPILRDALVAAFSAPAPTSGTIALDMRDVGFIDSAGLALLVEIRKLYYEKSKLALIVQKGSQPERVLRLGRFDTFLKVGYQPADVVQSAAAV